MSARLRRRPLVPVTVVMALVCAAVLSGRPVQATPLTSGGYTTDATVSPAAVSSGGSLTITASVRSAAASTVLVDVEVYSPAGSKVGQQVFSDQRFSAGQLRTYPVNWTAPSGSPSGSYSVKVGVFAPNWGTLHHWNDNAAAFTVGGSSPSPTPAPTPTPSATPAPTGLPALPAGWPSTLQLGMMSDPGDAAAMKATAPFGYRYQYLAGGVNTGQGWATWNADGQFVTYYIQDSIGQGIRPVFTYYMMFQTAPGNGQSEADGTYTNLQNRQTMTAYYNDLKLFFQRAGAFSSTNVVLHVEPDLWGYMQQRAGGDNAASVPAQVAATGLADLAGLPNTFAGFAQAIVKLRDRYAPNVQLGYHVSVWGTGTDIGLADPPDATVDALGTRAANFYRSLGTNFDVAFAEFSDRDAGFKQAQYGDGGASWWDADDFRRNARFLRRFVQGAGERVVMWQIPYGNTKMRAMNNTWGHYQDNRVEWLLDDPDRGHLTEYVQAGVIGFLFGQGAGGTTCPCDAMGDGVTNPAPINGNTRASLTADDDGGFFRDRARAYYQAGAMALPASGSNPTPTPSATPSPTPSPTPRPSATPTPPPTPTPTPTPTPRPSATPTPTPTPTSAPGGFTQGGYTTSATVSPTSVARGGVINLTVSVRAAAARSALVDVEVYSPSGAKVFQQVYDNQAFAAGQARTYGPSWTVPANAAAGQYTVKIGIFTPGWGALSHWNNQAAMVTVGAAP